MRRIVPVLFALTFGAAQAATFVVDTTNPDLAGALTFCSPAPNDCSFRGALVLAELDENEDTIQFNIPPGSAGCADGVCSIDLGNNSYSNWIYLNTPIVFDGRTQPGYAANTIPAGEGPMNGQPAIRLFTSQTNFSLVGFEFRDNGRMHGLRLENALLRFTPNALSWTFQGNWFTASQVEFLKENYAVALQDIQFGGLLPEQRNWLAESARLTFQQGAFGTRLRMQGNLFGTKRNGVEPNGVGNWNTISVEKYSPYSDILIGGSEPQARNIFSAALLAESVPGRLRIEGNHFGVGVDGTSPLGMYEAVAGNGFILGGETAAQANLIGYANHGHCAVDLNYVWAGEGRAVILGNRFVDNAGPTAICTHNMYTNRSRDINDAGDVDSGQPVAQSPQPGYEPTGPNLFQNAPEISAFAVEGQTVTLTYRVDSLPQYTTWPLRVEFYFSTTDAGEELLHVDSYGQSEAQQFKSIAFELPEGVTLTRTDVLVATASAPAPGYSTSHFSWYPVMPGFADDAPLVAGAPTPVKVQVRTLPRAPGQSAWPFTPNGLVRISTGPLASCAAASSPGTLDCFAVLQPSADDPTIAIGECALTIAADYPGAQGYLQARYCSRERAFAGRDAEGYGMEEPAVTRTPAIVPASIGTDMFCNSFEDNDPGCPPRD